MIICIGFNKIKPFIGCRNIVKSSLIFTRTWVYLTYALLRRRRLQMMDSKPIAIGHLSDSGDIKNTYWNVVLLSNISFLFTTSIMYVYTCILIQIYPSFKYLMTNIFRTCTSTMFMLNKFKLFNCSELFLVTLGGLILNKTLS